MFGWSAHYSFAIHHTNSVEYTQCGKSTKLWPNGHSAFQMKKKSETLALETTTIFYSNESFFISVINI